MTVQEQSLQRREAERGILSQLFSEWRSTVFLVDEPNEQLWSVSTDTGAEIRIPKDKGGKRMEGV